MFMPLQAFVVDLLLSVVNGFGGVFPSILLYDKLSVSVGWPSKLVVPLVFGSPYLTFSFNNQVPLLSSSHIILGVTANQEKTKHRVQLNNGQVRDLTVLFQLFYRVSMFIWFLFLLVVPIDMAHV